MRSPLATDVVEGLALLRGELAFLPLLLEYTDCYVTASVSPAVVFFPSGCVYFRSLLASLADVVYDIENTSSPHQSWPTTTLN